MRLLDVATARRTNGITRMGLRAYLKSELCARRPGGPRPVPPDLFVGSLKKDTEIVDWRGLIPEGELLQKATST